MTKSKKSPTTRQPARNRGVKHRLVRDSATGRVTARGSPGGPTIASKDIRAQLGVSSLKGPPPEPTAAERTRALRTILRLVKLDPIVLMRIVRDYYFTRIRYELPAKEKEITFRVCRVLARAAEVFGSGDAGNLWVITKQPALGNRQPFKLLSRSGGLEKVLKALDEIADPALKRANSAPASFTPVE